MEVKGSKGAKVKARKTRPRFHEGTGVRAATLPKEKPLNKDPKTDFDCSSISYLEFKTDNIEALCPLMVL